MSTLKKRRLEREPCGEMRDRVGNDVDRVGAAAAAAARVLSWEERSLRHMLVRELGSVWSLRSQVTPRVNSREIERELFVFSSAKALVSLSGGEKWRRVGEGGTWTREGVGSHVRGRGGRGLNLRLAFAVSHARAKELRSPFGAKIQQWAKVMHKLLKCN